MTTAARKALSSIAHFLSVEVWNRGKVPPPEQHEHRVGEYYADYSEPTDAQLVQPQPELDELFNKSKILSVKREL